MPRYLSLLLLLLLSVSKAWAHPISISSAVIDVKAAAIEVEIEIMLEDLVLYHQLAANAEMQYALRTCDAQPRTSRTSAQMVYDS